MLGGSHGADGGTWLDVQTSLLMHMQMPVFALERFMRSEQRAAMQLGRAV